MGAILAGQATCGVLVGSSIAIGQYCGRNIGAPPEKYPDARSRAIDGVKQLYTDFIQTFGATDCFTLSRCNFSNPQDMTRYVEQQAWKDKCDLFLGYAIRKCFQMSREGVL